MSKGFKLDILEKVLKFYVLFYFVLGFLINYLWICKELDMKTDFNIIVEFYNPVVIVTGLMDILLLVFVFILFRFHLSKKNSDSGNSESHILFYAITIPAFLTTIVYSSINVISSVITFSTRKDFIFFMAIGEICIFVAVIILIHFFLKSKLIASQFQKIYVNFVVLLNIFGILNLICYHMSVQQVKNFIKIASKFLTLSKFYNVSSVSETGNHSSLIRISGFLQPFVILFCFVILSYLVLVYNSAFCEIEDTEHDSTEELILKTRASEDDIAISYNQTLSSSFKVFRSVNLPPFSLGLAILFITVTFFIIAIANNMMNSTEFYVEGQLISSIFPIPIYLFSIFLLFIQLNDIGRWEKVNTNNLVIDRMILWVGAAGQVLEIVAQVSMNSFQYHHTLSHWIILEYVILFFQTMFQTLVISLILDRKWAPPELKSWHEYLCPPVGLLSLNLSFMIFSLFDIVNTKSLNVSSVGKNPYLFMRIFTNGFQSFGVTLAILQRLHSSLIFGKMIFFRNA